MQGRSDKKENEECTFPLNCKNRDRGSDDDEKNVRQVLANRKGEEEDEGMSAAC